MCLMLQEIRFQVQVLKLSKSVKESSEKVRVFKTQELASVEVYEIQFFRVVFHQIREYVFKSSFLTTLNIYTDYFEGHKRLHKLHKSTIPQV